MNKRTLFFAPNDLDFLQNAQKMGIDESNPKIERMKKIVHIAVSSELTDRQRDCLTMRFFDKKSVKEIAEVLGIRPTTVYKHLRKAIQTLKECAKYL